MARLLLGLPFLVAGVYKLVDPTATGATAEAPGEAFFVAARDTFIFTELAVVEIVGALMVLAGVAVPLATLGLLPIVATIVVYAVAYVPPGPETTLVVSIVAGCGALLTIHRRRYATLLVAAAPVDRVIRRRASTGGPR